jgi:hypothetical protein
MFHFAARDLGRASLMPLAALICFGLPCRAVLGQETVPVGAVITGRVLGPDHEPIAGVEVHLRTAKESLDHAAITTPDDLSG